MGISARKVFDGKKHGAAGKFTGIAPVDQWDVPQLEENARKPAFVYFCDNETVDGIEFGGPGSAAAFPFEAFDPEIPIVADMSSNFLSRPVDVSKYGIIYAGAQKNLGPSGVTLVIVREDLIGACGTLSLGSPSSSHITPQSTLTPQFSTAARACLPCSRTRTWPTATRCTSVSILLRQSAEQLIDLRLSRSASTPPTFAIYVCSLVLRSLLVSPPLPLPSPTARPLAPLSDFADQKSSLVYAEIDASSGFYVGTADAATRSRMNVTFRLPTGGEELEKKFVKEASEKGIKGVNGHRSVGGTSLALCTMLSAPS